MNGKKTCNEEGITRLYSMGGSNGGTGTKFVLTKKIGNILKMWLFSGYLGIIWNRQVKK